MSINVFGDFHTNLSYFSQNSNFDHSFHYFFQVRIKKPTKHRIKTTLPFSTHILLTVIYCRSQFFIILTVYCFSTTTTLINESVLLDCLLNTKSENHKNACARSDSITNTFKAKLTNSGFFICMANNKR